MAGIVTALQLIASDMGVINASFWSDPMGWQENFPETGPTTQYVDEFRQQSYACYALNQDWYGVNVRVNSVPKGTHDVIQSSPVSLADCNFCNPNGTGAQGVDKYYWTYDLRQNQYFVNGCCWWQTVVPNIAPNIITFGPGNFRNDSDHLYVWKIQLLGQEYPYTDGLGEKIDVVVTQYMNQYGSILPVSHKTYSWQHLEAGGGPYYPDYKYGLRVPVKAVLMNYMLKDRAVIDELNGAGNDTPIIPTDPVNGGNPPTGDNPPASDGPLEGTVGEPDYTSDNSTNTPSDTTGNTTGSTSSDTTSSTTSTGNQISVAINKKYEIPLWGIIAGVVLGGLAFSK